MEKELKKLINYLNKINSPLKKEAAMLILNNLYDGPIIKEAQLVLKEELDIDLWELQSLVSPSKFEFPEPEIGVIGVKDEENI